MEVDITDAELRVLAGVARSVVLIMYDGRSDLVISNIISKTGVSGTFTSRFEVEVHDNVRCLLLRREYTNATEFFQNSGCNSTNSKTAEHTIRVQYRPMHT